MNCLPNISTTVLIISFGETPHHTLILHNSMLHHHCPHCTLEQSGSQRLNNLSKAQESKVTVVNGGDCPEKGSGQECPKPKRPIKLTKNAKDPFTLGKSQAQTVMR